MIEISEQAQDYFRKLLAQQDEDVVGIRMTAVEPGTLTADCRLEFCFGDELAGDEWSVECEGFTLYVDAASVRWLDQAEIDLQRQGTASQLTVRAPGLKAPPEDASLPERIRHVLDTEVNPQLAAHGGRVALEEVDGEGLVRLRFGGGCHGCGMADVTLKQGIEKTLRARFPEITAIADATDHASGSNPYYQRGG